MTTDEMKTEIDSIRTKLKSTPVGSIEFTELVIALLALYDSYVAATSNRMEAA